MLRQVMIVDSRPDIQLLIKAIFEPRDFNVICVNSGERCIEELENGFRGVVLMDVTVPDLEAWTAIGEIVNRGLTDGIAILMMEASQDFDQWKGISFVGSCHIKKPYVLSTLFSQVCEFSEALTGNEINCHRMM